MKNKQSSSAFNVMNNLVPDDCVDPVSVFSVSIIVAPGLRSIHSAVDIDFLKIKYYMNMHNTVNCCILY